MTPKIAPVFLSDLMKLISGRQMLHLKIILSDWKVNVFGHRDTSVSVDCEKISTENQVSGCLTSGSRFPNVTFVDVCIAMAVCNSSSMKY